MSRLIAHAMDGAVSAAGVVFHANGNILMLQRPCGEWGFPAGSVEPNETSEQAARRETMEETGYVHSGDLTSVGIFDGFFQAYFADVEQFEVAINEEHIGQGWFAIDALPTPLHGCSGNVLACVFNAIAGDKSDSARMADINGYFEVRDNPVSKVGVFPYLGRSIPQEAERGNGKKFFNVYRPAEELADPATIASLRLKPWIIDHTMIGDGTGGTAQIEDKVARGVTGERGWFDAEDGTGTLKTNIMCWSDRLAALIESGKVELSLGYRCIYEYAPGTWNGIDYTYVQRRIRFNHLATVDSGRMGPEVAVMDSNDNVMECRQMASKAAKQALMQARAKSLAGKTKNRLLAFAMDAEEAVEKGEDTTGEMAAAVESIKKAVPLLEALEEIQCVGESEELGLDEEEDPEKKEKNGSATDSMLSPGDKRAEAKDAEEGKDKEGKGMDAAEVKRIVDAAVKGALASVMDSKDVIRTVADRDALVKKVAPHIAGIEQIATAMDASELAVYAVEKLEIPARKGSEVDALEGWLHGRTPAHKQPMSHTMDGKDRPKGKSFLAAQIADRK